MTVPTFFLFFSPLAKKNFEMQGLASLLDLLLTTGNGKALCHAKGKGRKEREGRKSGKRAGKGNLDRYRICVRSH